MTKEERLKKRHSAEKRFRFYGIASIFVALLFVLILVHNIFSKGSSAFMKTAINVEVFFDPELIDVQNGASIDEIMQSDFFDITIETLLKTYPVNDFDQENELIDLFETLGIKDRMNHYPSELSGGERSRVALIRAIINRPSILFADEPTGNLDEKNSKNLVDLLIKINRDFGQSIILTTHNPDIASIGDRQFILENGSLYE